MLHAAEVYGANTRTASRAPQKRIRRRLRRPLLPRPPHCFHLQRRRRRHGPHPPSPSSTSSSLPQHSLLLRPHVAHCETARVDSALQVYKEILFFFALVTGAGGRRERSVPPRFDQVTSFLLGSSF